MFILDRDLLNSIGRLAIVRIKVINGIYKLHSAEPGLESGIKEWWFSSFYSYITLGDFSVIPNKENDSGFIIDQTEI